MYYDVLNVFGLCYFLIVTIELLGGLLYRLNTSDGDLSM